MKKYGSLTSIQMTRPTESLTGDITIHTETIRTNKKTLG